MAIAHVVVFVQGTHRFLGDLSIDRLASGLSHALGAQCRPTGTVEAYNFHGKPIAGRTIEERDNAGAYQPAIRLLECGYYDIFEEIEEMTLIGRAWRTIKTVFSNLPLARHIRGFSNKSEGRLQRAYLLTLFLINILAPLVLIGLIGALVYQLFDAIGKSIAGFQPSVTPPGSPAAPAAPPAPSDWSIVVGYVAGFVSLLALAKILWSNFVGKRVRSFVTMFARDPLCMLEYLARTGAIADRVIARVDKAIAFAQEQHPGAKVHIVAYSFGAIVSYDWLFPRAGDAPSSATRAIHTFVALGFPFRMVMTFWRRYFEEGRSFTPAPLQHFVNCSLKEDLVGTKIPTGNGITRALSDPARISDLENDQPPSALSNHWFAEGLRRAKVHEWDGVRAHAAYFGFKEDFTSQVFAHCADAIRRAT